MSDANMGKGIWTAGRAKAAVGAGAVFLGLMGALGGAQAQGMGYGSASGSTQGERATSSSMDSTATTTQPGYGGFGSGQSTSKSTGKAPKKGKMAPASAEVTAEAKEIMRQRDSSWQPDWQKATKMSDCKGMTGQAMTRCHEEVRGIGSAGATYR